MPRRLRNRRRTAHCLLKDLMYLNVKELRAKALYTEDAGKAKRKSTKTPRSKSFMTSISAKSAATEPTNCFTPPTRPRANSDNNNKSFLPVRFYPRTGLLSDFFLN